MPRTTIAEAFDFPFRWVRQHSDPTYYAVGTLRMEPSAKLAVEYAVALPDIALLPWENSCAEAAGKGIRAYAEEQNIVGVRVTLTAMQTHDVDSSDYSFFRGAQRAMEDALKAHGIPAKPVTISEAFDFPFHRIGQTKNYEPYYAVGLLRLEPVLAGSVEYVVDLSDVALVPSAPPSFAEAVGAGIKQYAAENNIVGLRVTLKAIEADDVGSSDYWFSLAAQSALEDAIKAWGVFVGPITVDGVFEQPLRWVKQNPGAEKYAIITLRLEPLQTQAVEFGLALSGEALPPDVYAGYITATEDGVRNYAKRHDVVGIRVTLISIEAHPTASSRVSFEIAGYQAMQSAIETHGALFETHGAPFSG